MFINATFPLWFCIIPLLGMVFMLVVMFFVCRGGWITGYMNRCGCGSGKAPIDQGDGKGKGTLPTDNT
jgi:hypothetical protein